MVDTQPYKCQRRQQESLSSQALQKLCETLEPHEEVNIIHLHGAIGSCKNQPQIAIDESKLLGFCILPKKLATFLCHFRIFSVFLITWYCPDFMAFSSFLFFFSDCFFAFTFLPLQAVCEGNRIRYISASSKILLCIKRPK